MGLQARWEKRMECALTWEGYKNFNGLKISTVHNVADKSFKLWFSDVKVVLE